MSNKLILRAQACRFLRANTPTKEYFDWEPGIAYLKSFGDAQIEFIIDAQGEKLTYRELYDYSLLRLRVDGYIAIEAYDYAVKSDKPTMDEGHHDACTSWC
jgi:hypothetical protein